MVRLLIRDIASPDRADPLFPFLRTFDPYAGHSWASGKAGFADGNNQESSSEAMNAWTGIILFGQAVGDRALRDLGIWLFTTELEAIENYWFDVEGRHRPAAYTPSVVTMIWGGKGVNETWFSADPAMVHGINWLPFHGGSLYLGRHPEYCRRNFEALLREAGGSLPAAWRDLALMYRALEDPGDAIRRLEAEPRLAVEAGNSRANLYHWTHALRALGRVDRGVTADHPLHAVFEADGRRTHVAYNMGPGPIEVRFSDGTVVEAAGRGFAVRVTEKR
jgi:endoglucanase Acf2